MELKNKGSYFFKRTVSFRSLGFLAACIVAVLLASCASVPEDMMISTATEEETRAVEKVAQDLAYLDGTSLLGNTDVAAAAQRCYHLRNSFVFLLCKKRKEVRKVRKIR